MFESWAVGIITFIVGFAAGRWQANKAKDDEELADPTVHVLERKIYWLSNINLAYNKIKQMIIVFLWKHLPGDRCFRKDFFFH